MASLLLTWGCSGGASQQAALSPWPATGSPSNAPGGGPPSPPGLTSPNLRRALPEALPTEDPVLTVALSAGWNMVSLPVTEVTTVSADAGVYSSAFAWDPDLKQYTMVDLGDPAALNSGAGTDRGLWVYSDEAAELRITGRLNSGSGSDTFTDLIQGWNLVAVPYAQEQPFSAAQIRSGAGPLRFLRDAVGLEVSPADPTHLLYGYGFVYDPSGYHTVGLNNPEAHLAVGQAMWVYVNATEARLWYEVPAPPVADSTLSATVEEGASLIALDQDGNLFVDDSQAEAEPESAGRFLLEGSGPSVRILAVPSGATYRIFVLLNGATWPLYQGPANCFQIPSAVDFDFGTISLVDGQARPQNPPGAGVGLVPAGADPSAPSFEDPALAGKTVKQLVALGIRATAQESFLLARAYLGAASRLAGESQSADADAARFFLALSRIGALGQEMPSDGADDGLNDLGDFLDAAGFDKARRSDGGALVRPATFPQTTPTGEDLRRFLATRIRSEFEAALQGLEAISPTFEYVVSLQDGTLIAGTHEVDYGDVLALRASYRTILGKLLILASYNLGGSLTAQLNTENPNLQTFLAASPNALYHQEVALVSQARQLLDRGLQDYQEAIDHMLAETDPQEDDAVNLPDPEQARQYRDRLGTWRQALTQATRVGSPSGPSARLDLSKFFDADGLALRPFLPPLQDGEPAGMFQGQPFGDVYSDYEPGGPMDPNRDDDEDGLPDLLSDGEPRLVDTWKAVAPEGEKVVDLAKSPDGNTVYALCASGDWSNSYLTRVVRLTAQGQPQATWPLKASGLVTDPRLETYHIEVAPTGGVHVLAGSSFYDPGNAYDYSRQYATQYWGFSPQGVLAAEDTRIGNDPSVLLFGVAWLPDGTFLATTGDDHLRVFDAQGQVLRTLAGPGSAPGQFDRPGAIELGPDGLVYVADCDNDRIQVLTPDGGFRREVPLGGWHTPKVTRLDFDPTGRLLVRAGVQGYRHGTDGRPMNRWYLPWGGEGGLAALPGHVSLFGGDRDILVYRFPYAP